MSEENNNEAVEEAPAEEQQETKSEVTFTQEQVNALIAKERNRTARKVKQQLTANTTQQSTKQEPASSTGQPDEPPPWAHSLLSEVGELKQKLEARESEQSFTADIAGIEIESDEREILRTLYEHNPDVYERKLAALKSKNLPPSPKGPGFNGIGAPNPIPSSDRDPNPSSWDADTVARYRKEGTFLKRIEQYKSTLPGGSGGLFPAKNHSRG